MDLARKPQGLRAFFFGRGISSGQSCKPGLRCVHQQVKKKARQGEAGQKPISEEREETGAILSYGN
jgi:hypothetical protein